MTTRPCRRSGVGADLKEFQTLFAPRVAELACEFIAPLDELSHAVTESSRSSSLRSRKLHEMTESGTAISRSTSATYDRRP